MRTDKESVAGRAWMNANWEDVETQAVFKAFEDKLGDKSRAVEALIEEAFVAGAEHGRHESARERAPDAFALFDELKRQAEESAEENLYDEQSRLKDAMMDADTAEQYHAAEAQLERVQELMTKKGGES